MSIAKFFNHNFKNGSFKFYDSHENLIYEEVRHLYYNFVTDPCTNLTINNLSHIYKEGTKEQYETEVLGNFFKE